jgi:hypothetical protein
MKNVAIACAALLLFAATAKAGDLAVSKSTLGSMGLGSMQTLSDNEGATVRGKGTFAGVWGGSTANWFGGQTSSNNYEAGASWIGKNSAAIGGSLSFAGKAQVQYLQDPTGAQLSVVVQAGFAGGLAGAAAW